jgi:hypothetical protein
MKARRDKGEVAFMQSVFVPAVAKFSGGSSREVSSRADPPHRRFADSLVVTAPFRSLGCANVI